MVTQDTTYSDGAHGRGSTMTTAPAKRLLFSLVVCLIVGAFFLIHPPVALFNLTATDRLTVWSDVLLLRFRWPVVAALLLLSLATYRLHRTGTPGRLGTLASAFLPLCLLPLAGAVTLVADLLPTGATAHAIFFMPPLVAALILGRLLAPLWLPAREGGREWTGLVFMVPTLVFSLLGWYLATETGEHVGDEGHYLVQAQSLYEDHDLDVANNVLAQHGAYALDHRSSLRDFPDALAKSPADPTIRTLLVRIHISIRSLGGHWYSNHPYGLPVLLAPIWACGLFIRYLLLALISSLGCVALYRISRGIGAAPPAAAIAVLTFAGSYYWAVYSARALPEVLGATLLAWLFWAILRQEARPWLATLVAAMACGYLPPTHERFMVPSLMGFGLFGLFGLFGRDESWPRKLVRLGVFTVLCFLAYTVHLMVQRSMFEAGQKFVFTLKDLFGYPPGMWGIIADCHGVTSVLPLFMWLAAAWGAWLMLARTTRERCFAAGVMATFLIVLVTSCANSIYNGGSCVPGRYLAVAVPLLVPAAAFMFGRTNGAARTWFLFLGLVSTWLLMLVIMNLDWIGRGFINPLVALPSTRPAFLGLFMPHASFLRPSPGTGFIHHATTAYVACGMGLTLALILLPARLIRAAVVLALLAAGLGGFAHWAQTKQPDARPPLHGGADGPLSKYLSEQNTDRARIVRCSGAASTNLFDVCRVTLLPGMSSTNRFGVTTTDLGVMMKGALVSQPRVGSNDWAGRPLKWTTLGAPRKPVRGGRLLHIAGDIEGTARPVLALREGRQTLFEGPIPMKDGKVDWNIEFHCRGNSGDLYTLIRLEGGEGTLLLSPTYWSPFSEAMLAGSGIQPPADRFEVPAGR